MYLKTLEDTKASEIAGIPLKGLREHTWENDMTFPTQVFSFPQVMHRIEGIAIVCLICNRPVSAVSPKWKAF